MIAVYKVLYYYWPTWRAYTDDTDKSQGLPEADPSWTYGGKYRLCVTERLGCVCLTRCVSMVETEADVMMRQ